MLMDNKIKICLLALAFLLCMGVFGGYRAISKAGAAAREDDPAAGLMSGVWYPLGVVIAAALSRRSPGGRAMLHGDAVARGLWRGGRLKRPAPRTGIALYTANGRARLSGRAHPRPSDAAALYREPAEAVLRMNGIRGVENLKRRRAAVRWAGGSTANYIRRILEAHDIRGPDAAARDPLYSQTAAAAPA